MKYIAPLFLFLAFLASGARAESVTARVVADDYYSVYVGNASGSSMTLVGGSGSALWMSQGAPFGFSAGAGDYLYVAAWDSASYGPPHMWIGEFNVGGTMLYSNTSDWVAKYDASLKDPSAAQVSALAQSAGAWLAVAASMPNGSAPYGGLIGSSPASMVWHDSFGGDSASERGYALYRTAMPVVAVPEPSVYLMFLAGLGLLGFAARRRV